MTTGGGSDVLPMLGLPPAVRACLFDLDGVLTSTARVHAAAWKKTFDTLLLARAAATKTAFVPFDSALDFERYVDGRARLDGTRSFLAARGIHLAEGDPEDPPGRETVHGIANAKNDAFTRLLGEQHALAFEGSVRYVRAVRAARFGTAVVSSSRHCRQVLAAAEIADLFDAIVDGVVAAQRGLAAKPSPDVYLLAARELGVAPAQASVFEDALAGVEAGRAGAFGYVVGVDRVGQSTELLRRGANVVVRDLAELLGPT